MWQRAERTGEYLVFLDSSFERMPVLDLPGILATVLVAVYPHLF